MRKLIDILILMVWMGWMMVMANQYDISHTMVIRTYASRVHVVHIGVYELENPYETELFAKCVEAEASNQGFEGKRLVADVILNRVDSEKFPDDIESVITQKNAFSSYSDGGIDRAEPTDETYEAIKLEQEQRKDSEILYFSAGEYNKYSIPAYKYKEHYFGY